MSVRSRGCEELLRSTSLLDIHSSFLLDEDGLPFELSSFHALGKRTERKALLPREPVE
jgi:hypothetical protein